MKLNDSEWAVMQALWAGKCPITARDVHAEVEPETDWSYSTVRTLLTRLAAKGALTETKRGKQLLYTPALAQDDARHSALRSLVDKAFGGTFGSLVQHLAEAEKLSPRERVELIELIEQADAGKKRPTPGARRRRRS